MFIRACSVLFTFSGSIEFRRGGTRPYIKPESATGRKPRYSQPVYVPPASRRETK